MASLGLIYTSETTKSHHNTPTFHSLCCCPLSRGSSLKPALLSIRHYTVFKSADPFLLLAHLLYKHRMHSVHGHCDIWCALYLKISVLNDLTLVRLVQTLVSLEAFLFFPWPNQFWSCFSKGLWFMATISLEAIIDSRLMLKALQKLL